MIVMNTELVTPVELAQRLRVPPRTLDQWAYRGSGPAFIKVGRHRRYRPEDIEAWLDAQTTNPDAA